LILFFSANIAAALASGIAVSRRLSLWFVPIALIFLTYPQAFISWNGDANEIGRHAVEHNITERLGIWMLVLFATDLLLQVGMPRLPRVRAWFSAHYKSVVRRVIHADSAQS
jgi:hypothetical protein